MTVQLQRRTFTVDDYHRMLEAGILTEDDRVELICGEIITMAPIGSMHWGTVNWLDKRLQALLGDRALVSSQSSIRLGRDSEPQPDIAVFRPRPDYYIGNLPTAQDAYLVIEVADTTVAFDREVKVPLYGKAGVPEMWLVDIPQRRVEVYRSPSRDGYGSVRYASPGEMVSLATFPDVALQVAELLR